MYNYYILCNFIHFVFFYIFQFFLKNNQNNKNFKNTLNAIFIKYTIFLKKIKNSIFLFFSKTAKKNKFLSKEIY